MNLPNKPHPLLLLTFCSLVVVTAGLPAQAETSTNVAGEEIIYSDDSFKPVVRDLGANKEMAPATNTKEPPSKPVRGGRLADSLDTKLNEAATISVDVPLEDAPENESETINPDDLWQRIKNGYGIPDSKSSLVANHENWYSSRPDYVKRMVERSQRYLFHVVEEIEKRDMPTELALLPMIESAYNPKAYSTSRASGIWQFVPSTGKYFGLKQDWWVDNRRNITFATDAALTYLQKLYNMFGAWDLALAAYNAGEGTVSRAIERNRKLGLPTDYESINLPPETRNYVPKLQAVKNLMTNPSAYGLNIQTIANTPYFAKVAAPAQMDAHLAAKLAEISDEEFLALNPSYNRPVIANENKNLELLLPILSAQTFRTNLATYNKPLVTWKTYLTKRGERIDTIAKKFGINLSKLREANNLSGQNKIKKPATILVPNEHHADTSLVTPKSAGVTDILPLAEAASMTNGEQASADIELNSVQNNPGNEEESEPKSQKNISHTVKKGESIYSIAKHYGITAKQVMVANSLKNARVKVGQVLDIHVQKSSPNKKKKAQSKKSTKKQKTSAKAKKSSKHKKK